MRRLPVFLLLDVSDSMVGESLDYLQKGLKDLVRSLRQDPQALEKVFLSVIAFAGRAKTVAPLIDLPTFYAPNLPIGSGTGLGGALEHLMSEMDRQVVRTTREQRGDWQPIIYLFTDGKPTDNCLPAIERWNSDYAKRAHMVAIGLGRYADTTVLSQFANEVLRYNGEDEADFGRFIQWITASVQSRSIAADMGDSSSAGRVSLEKAGGVLETASDEVQVDQDCVVLVGRCQGRKSPYLLKFDRAPSFREMGIGDVPDADPGEGLYNVVGCFPVSEDYFEWSDPGVAGAKPSVDLSELIGGAGCPHCGNRYVFGLCRCGKLFCVDGPGAAACPWCNEEIMMGVGGDNDPDISVERSRG